MLPMPGTETRIIFPAAKELPVWVYQPLNLLTPNRIIVAVHGISRDYKLHVSAYKKLADQLGCWLIVPEFKNQIFPYYQLLSKDSISYRADIALNTVLIAFKAKLRQSSIQMHLCGYSGGAQFAHRYAMLYPQNIASLILCSAGWYTVPDKKIDYPYGIATWPEWLGKLKLEDMLCIPTLVMVGEADIKREKSLRKSRSLDTQQGRNRVERAENWVREIDKYKLAQQSESIKFSYLPKSGHDFKTSVETGQLISKIEAFLNEFGGTKVCEA